MSVKHAPSDATGERSGTAVVLPPITPRQAKILRLVFSVGICVLAALALHALSREVRFSSIRSALAATPPAALLLSVLFTAVSFTALACYDVITTRFVAPGRVPFPLAAATGAAGYAVSNLLGFALFTGGALRARVYARRGLDVGAVGNILATSWVTFWMGVALMGGTVLALNPDSAAGATWIGPALLRGIGVAMIAATVGILAWIGTGKRTIVVGSLRVPMPPLPVASAQIGAAFIDFGAAAIALYVLMPANDAVGPAAFLVAYILAIVLGVISHSPGGLGVFEATLLGLTGLAGNPDALAALILYRLIYYILPFVLTAVGLAAVWVRVHRGRIGAGGALIAEGLSPFVPPIAGGVAIISGIVLLVSGTLPAEVPRLNALRQVAPLAVIETSHMFGSAIGVILVVLARGLAHRQRRSWTLALAALALGMAASLLKGIDWEEVLILGAAAGMLIAFRDAFYRRSEAPMLLSPQWLLGVALLLGASVWLGLFAYRHVDYGNELWWHFAWSSDASRFLRASVAAAVVLMAIGAASLLNPVRRPLPPDPVPDSVRRLVAASSDPETNIALLGDKRFLVSADETAFLMYAQTGAALIAKSDPVGDPAAGTALAWDLRERADRLGLIPAFYAVGTRYLPTYLDMGLSILKIGEVARVDLTSFSLDGARRKDLRYARSRAARDGLAFAMLPPEAVPALIGELTRVSDAWLAEKRGAEKAFALGRFDPEYLANFAHAVLRRPDGSIAAFANIWRSGGLEEVSVDLMRHDPTAPAVTMDALFAEMLLWSKEHGYRHFNLGAAPFSGMAEHRLATSWNRVGAFVYRHAEDIYHFDGLRSFKQKFDPQWSPNYLACPGGLASARVLVEVNRLISGGARGLLG